MAGTHHTALVDRCGHLCTCGAATPEGQLLAGHGGDNHGTLGAHAGGAAADAGPTAAAAAASAAGAGAGAGGAPPDHAEGLLTSGHEGVIPSGPERVSALQGVRVRSVA